MTAVAVCTLYPRPEGPGFTVRGDKYYKLWPERESNPHGVTPRDFKSRAYASSAIGP